MEEQWRSQPGRLTLRKPIRHGCGLALRRRSSRSQNSSGSTLASTSSWINVRTFRSTDFGSRFDNSIKLVKNFRHFSLELSNEVRLTVVVVVVPPMGWCCCWWCCVTTVPTGWCWLTATEVLLLFIVIGPELTTIVGVAAIVCVVPEPADDTIMVPWWCCCWCCWNDTFTARVLVRSHG